MSMEYNILKVNTGEAYNPIIGKKEPLSHPVNCKNECPYGYDRAFCFPCMLKIQREMKAKRTSKETEYSHGI